MTRDEYIQEALARYRRWRAVHRADGTWMMGFIVITTPSGRDFRFRMKVFVPPDFPQPDAHPTAHILKHNVGVHLGSEAHVEPDGKLCVQMPERHEINYREVGLVGFLDQVTLHLDRARIYAAMGTYPGEAYSHGITGRREYQRELPQLREDYAQRREALLVEVPEPLRHYVNPSDPRLDDQAWCQCGSGRRFSECHKEVLTQVRVRVTDLGMPPAAPRPEGPRNCFTPPRRKRRRRR